MMTRMTEHEVDIIAIHYRSGRRIISIARQMNRSTTSVRNALGRRNIAIRRDRYNTVAHNPSPEEIALETAKIRESWHWWEERARRDVAPYQFPMISHGQLALEVG